jgi:hypothetical protein
MRILVDVIAIRKLPNKRSGFALVATVSMMVLLSMVALAMLSLASLEQRSSGGAVSAGNRAARANARLALMMAIGELQRAMGPDQRVSAEGGLTGTAGYGKSHWVGAWSSEDADGDLEPDGEFKGWLVSSNLSGADGVPYEEISSDASSNDENWVRLVGSGTVDTNTQNDHEVYTQRISVNAPGTEGAGHFAWWVGDEGVKARVDLRNTQSDLELASQGTQRSALEVIPGFESVDNADPLIQKMVSRATMGMLGGASAQALKDHFHSMTVHSLALQTDTRHGGLKKDLSLLFEMTDQDFEAISPETYAAYVNAETPVSADSEVPKGLLFHDQGIHGPTIDLLRNHYRQYKANIGSGLSPMMVAGASYPNKTEFDIGTEGDPGYVSMWSRTACIQAWHWGQNTDPNTSTVISPSWWGRGQGDFPMPRLLKGNVTPYLNRVIMYFSVKAVPIPDNTPLNAQDDKYNLQLKLQPVLYVHNPFNVSMRVDGMRYLRNISESQLAIRKNQGTPEIIDLSSLLDANDEATSLTSGDRRGEAQFVVDHTVDFAPGEIKIFVPSASQNWGAEMKMEELSSAYQPDVMALTLNLTYVTGLGGGPTEAISQISFGTEVQVSVRWKPFSMEDFEIYENARGGYNTVWSGLSQERVNYSTGMLSTYVGADVLKAQIHLVEDLMTTTPMVVDDRFVKAAKFDRHWVSGFGSDNERRGIGTLVGPSSFVIGNPLCSSDSNTLGVTTNNKRIPGGGVYSNMMHSHMDFGQVGYVYFQNAFIDNYGTWGSNNGSAGERYTTVLEVPTAPLHSLGALQHANIAVEGYQPGLAIGNSFPNLTMEDHSKIVEPAAGQQNFDLSYMSNRALWDSYYFSSITPRPGDPSYGSLVENTNNDIESVISEFVTGQESLGNSRMQLIHGQSATQNREAELKDFKSSAAHLAVTGGFNVNSVSVDAWRAFLSGYRDAALRTAAGLDDENDEVSFFPRMSLPVTLGAQGFVAQNENAWTAFSKLGDAAIENLSQEIVSRIKSRAQLRMGEQVVNPCLTMGQFVNRMLVGDEEAQTRGLLQAALDASLLNQAMDDYGVYDSANYGSRPEQHSYAGDGENVKIPSASSAPTYVLQSDILQALGASMTVRSDTFVVRSYGDAVDSRGDVTARAWCEAIVQRVPEPVVADANNAWEPADQTFGRRMKLVSFRWLSKEEI